ncbi:hypothetical protein D3C81_2091550 [compost metagenome]
MTVCRSDCDFTKATDDTFTGPADDIAITILIGIAITIIDVANNIEVRIEAIGADRAGHPAISVAFVTQLFAQRPGFVVA